ncbi:MAG: hypothetical protein H7252_05365 [Cytophaga sp.]|nr:hypothetical protein [Undibacterium sp.]
MISHNAPPVVYPLGRSRFQGWVLFVLWFAGLLLLLDSLRVQAPSGWRAFAILMSVVVAGVAARMGWKNSPIGLLAWDGQLWRWEGPGYQSGVVEQKLLVVFDFQNLLMLQLENPAKARLWLWAERKAAPERWLDLRRAVYSPHKAIVQTGLQNLDPINSVPAMAVSKPGCHPDFPKMKP